MHKIKTIGLKRSVQNLVNGGQIISFRSKLKTKNNVYTGMLVTKNNTSYRLNENVHKQLRVFSSALKELKDSRFTYRIVMRNL